MVRRLPPSRSSSTKPTVSSTGAIARACESCVAILDGSHVETLVDTSQGDARPGPDATKWCVGITVDPERRQIYWTQKGPTKGGLGRLLRANIDIPKGESATNRTDIEVLFEGLPEPIDLELDRTNRILYWTDRGDPPRGNTVNRISIDAKLRQ